MYNQNHPVSGVSNAKKLWHFCLFPGFVRGVGRGLAGTVLKPMSKVTEAISDVGSGDGPASRPSATSVPDRAGDRMDRGKSEGNMEVSLKEKDDMGDLMKNGGTCHGFNHV